MRGVWRLVAPPSGAIITLAEAKSQTNTVDFDDDDALLQSLCEVATAQLDLAGGTLRRALLTQSWHYLAPAPVCAPHAPGYGFRLDRRPLQAVTKIEAMIAGAYVEQTLADFAWRDLPDGATWLRPKSGVALATADQDEAAWRITVTLGFGAAADVPAQIKQAALLIVGHLYQNREATVSAVSIAEMPMGFEALIAPWRTIEF